MGTRADFYVGRGTNAEWLGSIAYDGHSGGIDDGVRRATTETEFRAAVSGMLEGRRDATRPQDGWPWPWLDSRTTDYAYAFDDGQTWASTFGHAWWTAREGEPSDSMDGPKVAVFPDMAQRQAVTLGPRSGVFVGAIKT